MGNNYSRKISKKVPILLLQILPYEPPGQADLLNLADWQRVTTQSQLAMSWWVCWILHGIFKPFL